MSPTCRRALAAAMLIAVTVPGWSGSLTTGKAQNMLAGVIFQDRFQLGPGSVFRDCDECPAMVVIPEGVFTQGSPESEPFRQANEGPQREVSVPLFAIGQAEVTFAQWDTCVAENGCTHSPGDLGWGRGSRPVIGVSWNDAQEYIAWLTTKTGQVYRLPSESEWEYATRAGTSSRFNTGDCITSDDANFQATLAAPGCETGLFRDETSEVASFDPNAFGLHDTHGNVYELVQDCYNASYEDAPTDGSAWLAGDCVKAIIRGGSWSTQGNVLRSAARFQASDRDRRFSDMGFRVARSVEF